MIHLFRPTLGWQEMWAVAKVLASRWWGNGPVTKQFEQAYAEFLGVDEVMTLATASDALCLSMEILDVGPGDEIIIPSIHFIAAATAVLRRGATPVFCDVDWETLNTTPKFVAEKRTKKTKAVMALHYGGIPCDVPGITAMGLPVIEDAAVAVGTKFGGQMCGTLGTVGLWSFDAMKMIAAGAGGALWCREPYLRKRAKLLTNLGLDQPHGLTSLQERWWEYRLERPGRLSEMNDLSAAIALCQLKRLPWQLRRRAQVCCRYYDGLRDVADTPLPPYAPNLYWIQTPKRDELARHLREQGIYTSFRYHPLHWALETGDELPGAEYAARNTLLLPLHGALTNQQVRRIIREIRAFFEGAKWKRQHTS